MKLRDIYLEQVRKPNLKSIADIDRSNWNGEEGGSIGYMEYEDGTEMTPQEIQDYFEANHELYDDIMNKVLDPKDLGSKNRDTSKDTTSGEFNVNVPVDGEREKVNIKYGHVTGPVDDVTISWGNESHNVDFEAEDVIDDHGNEGKDMTFVAYSDDDKWRFIVDVSVGFNYEDSGEIQDVDWGTLEIDVDDSKKEPLNERFQKLAGIKPLYEQGFDDRLKSAMGMSDDEFEDEIASRDIGSSFPGTDSKSSEGKALASRTIEHLRREHYRNMSDQDLDDFSAEMIEHFLDNTAAQARAKIVLANKGSNKKNP